MEARVKINRFEYKVKMLEWNDERLRMDDGELHFGVTDMKDKEIYLANNLDEQTLTNTIIHEVTHAYIDSYGMLQVEWTDEILADFMATHLANICETLSEIEKGFSKEKADGKRRV